jgi:hypothetical protein
MESYRSVKLGHIQHCPLRQQLYVFVGTQQRISPSPPLAFDTASSSAAEQVFAGTSDHASGNRFRYLPGNSPTVASPQRSEDCGEPVHTGP